MDAIVEQALVKWPNVPDCYGWLALDARGDWRMRNEHAQEHALPGDKITQPALRGFINRNYTCDQQGRWYFQNGPQRVYVDLEVAPYIAHIELMQNAATGFILQTGALMRDIQAVWLSDQGRMFLQSDKQIAMLDDRDLAQCLNDLQMERKTVADAQLMVWLEQGGANGALSLQHDGKQIPVNHIVETDISERCHFIRKPRPAS